MIPLQIINKKKIFFFNIIIIFIINISLNQGFGNYQSYEG